MNLILIRTCDQKAYPLCHRSSAWASMENELLWSRTEHETLIIARTTNSYIINPVILFYGFNACDSKIMINKIVCDIFKMGGSWGWDYYVGRPEKFSTIDLENPIFITGKFETYLHVTVPYFTRQVFFGGGRSQNGNIR